MTAWRFHTFFLDEINALVNLQWVMFTHPLFTMPSLNELCYSTYLEHALLHSFASHVSQLVNTRHCTNLVNFIKEDNT